MTALERARELVAEPKFTDADTLNEVDSERVLAIAAAGLALRDAADAVWAASEDAGLPADSYAYVAALARACDAYEAALAAALGGDA